KFHGAGQGSKALIAELIGGEIARALGFKVPELVFAELDASFGQIEGDEEVQDLLKASVGLNLGLHYLAGDMTFDPLVTDISPLLASQVVWLYCMLNNVHRTPIKTKLLLLHIDLCLIDHVAVLYFHLSWQDWEKKAVMPVTLIK